MTPFHINLLLINECIREKINHGKIRTPPLAPVKNQNKEYLLTDTLLILSGSFSYISPASWNVLYRPVLSWEHRSHVHNPCKTFISEYTDILGYTNFESMIHSASNHLSSSHCEPGSSWTTTSLVTG